MTLSWKILARAIPLVSSIVTAAPYSVDQTIPAIVSTAWLSDNIDASNVIVVDIRDAASYASGHIPGSLSIPFAYNSLWGRVESGDTLIMPPGDELLPDLAAQGLTLESSVVIVTATTQVPLNQVQGTRVAAALQYAGLATNQVGLLDGGYAGWVNAGGIISTNPTTPSPAVYDGVVNEAIVVDRAYVHANLNKANDGVVLLDARPTSSYNNGHIESALSLPMINIWNSNAIFKPVQELVALFEAAVGDLPVSKTEGEIIVYCQIGLMATGWYFVLTNVLGFENVRLYDGSIEDWIKEYPLVKA